MTINVGLGMRLASMAAGGKLSHALLLGVLLPATPPRVVFFTVIKEYAAWPKRTI
jgi:hypothetical protein